MKVSAVPQIEGLTIERTDRQHEGNEVKDQRMLFDGLFDIAQADGKIAPAEAEYLSKVATIFGLSSARVERAKAAVLGQAECEPCIVLGIDPLATDEQIRDAWLRQVRAHHPDRLMAQGLPEEAIKVANRKLALINDAYDRLRRERGLVPA